MNFKYNIVPLNFEYYIVSIEHNPQFVPTQKGTQVVKYHNLYITMYYSPFSIKPN